MKSANSSVVAIFLFLILAAAPATAAVIYVDADAVGAGTGTSWGDARTDLQSALTAAQAGDEIWVAAGVYLPSVEVGGTGDRFFSFQLKNGVAVYGGFAGGETELSQRDREANPTVASGDIGVPDDAADNCLHVFHHPEDSFLDATAVLDGFVIADGYGDLAGDSRKGAGMYNEDAEPSIVDCTFRENTTTGSSYARGGAMYNQYCSPTIIDCDFIDNYCYSAGGAIYNSGYSSAPASPRISGCLFSGNEAGGGGNGDGGAIYNSSNCAPTIMDCAFDGNSALYNGGAIYNYGSGGGGHVVNCLFTDNTAGMYGGALYDRADTELTCANSVFARNEVTAGNSHGGALYNTACDPSFVNCVFTGNTSGCVGKAIYNVQFADAAFANCIIGGEWAFYNGDDCVVSVTYCCLEQTGFEAPVLHNIYAAPLMVDPVADDYGLQAGSPCIDAGDNDALPLDFADVDGDLDVAEVIPWDLRGTDRRQDDGATVDTGNGDAPIVDIGACEFGLAVAVQEPGPAAARLNLRSYPNPFNPSTTLSFILDRDRRVELAIHDLEGRRVRTLLAERRAAGVNTVVWDGRDDAGRAVASGVYLSRLTVGDATAGQRLVLLK